MPVASFEAALVVREIEGETLILDTHRNLVHQLNATASAIWQMKRQGQSAESIAAAFVQDFDVTEYQAFEDVLVTLQKLESLSLLSYSEPPRHSPEGEAR